MEFIGTYLITAAYGFWKKTNPLKKPLKERDTSKNLKFLDRSSLFNES